MTPMQLFLYMFVMAGVTYLIRMLPLVLFRWKIRSRFFRSVLHYIPYAVLGVMTIPAIFTSADNVPAAAIGFVVALILSYFRKSLILVALSAAAATYLSAWILSIL